MTDPLLNDVAGYGDVVAVFEGERIVHAGRVSAQISKLSSNLSVTFTGSKYAQCVSHHIPNLYRSFDSSTDDPPGGFSSAASPGSEFAIRRGSSMLGKVKEDNGVWLTPMRPALMEQFRQFTAVKQDWNRNDFILEASLLPGARIYVGRAASQRNAFQGRAFQLTGGAIQVWLPRDQVIYLRRNAVWVVR